MPLPPPEPDEPLVGVERVQWRGGTSDRAGDHVAREEPLEIRVRGVPLAVVMRTPGHDEELVHGFLLTERIAAAPHEIASVRHCTEVDDPRTENNVVQATLDPSVEIDLARLRRSMFAGSSCGICGKASIEQVMSTAAPLSDPVRVDPEILYALPDRLRTAQAVFSATGGLHAAGLFTTVGEMLVAREDVGRHNAVDKAVGWAARHGRLPLSGCVLMVSGRVSFEIVQKALAARIPIIAAVSAPSSLAVELAREASMTLAAFIRGRRLCLYAGAERVGPG